MSWKHNLARACALPAAAVAGLVLAAAPAAAHVTVAPSEASAGSSTVLTFSVAHGCEGSPTTRIAVQIPEQILSVSPTRNPLWEVEKVIEQLDEPATDAHGNQVTERVAEVVYTANEPLPDGIRDEFELSLQLPDAAGETIAFPTIQTCEQGETAWTEVAADGSDEELASPAPTVTILPAEGGDTHGASAASDDTAETTERATDDTEAVAAQVQDDDADTLGVLALVAGLLGLAIGAVALVLVRRRA